MTKPPSLSLTRLESRDTPTSVVPTTSTSLIASGAGAGSRPLVQLYRADGSVRSEFFAFDPSFTGGVSVALADVNGDGVKDVIAAAGAGGAPHVKVFDGKSVDQLPDPIQPHAAVMPQIIELYSFFAFGTGFLGGVSVAGGDVDADGYADVVTGAGAGGAPHVRVFSGKTGDEIRSFLAFEAGFRGGVSVATGNVILNPTTAQFPPPPQSIDILVGSGPGRPAAVALFDGLTGDAHATLPVFGGFTGGVSVALGDLNADGYDDLIIGAGAGGGPHTIAYDGNTVANLPVILLPEGGLKPFVSFFAFDAGFRGGVRVAAADLIGDGRDEIVAAAGPGGAPLFRTFNDVGIAPLQTVVKFGFTPGTPEYTSGVTVGAANGSAQAPAPAVTREFDFAQGEQGWAAGFSDYTTANDPALFEFESGVRPLPATLGAGTGYVLQGHNRSDGLFMYLKRRLTAADGVVPNRAYRAEFTVRFGSDTPAGQFGIGGPPAEAVLLKAGAGAVEPRTELVPNPPPAPGSSYVMNVDKGNQSASGGYATVIGDVANGQSPNTPLTGWEYRSVTRTGTHAFPVRSDAAGNLWLLVGTDSGFEGLTRLYYQNIRVTLTSV